MTKNNLLLLLIIILGLLIRVFQISSYPPSLNWDEVSIGYNSYSILKTGKDEWNNFLPLIFRSYGDYKLPLYLYFTVPFVGIFGLNPVSVRIVSILAGVGLIVTTYYLTQKLFGSKFTSLTSSFIIAVSPWSIFLSRIALEANLYLLIFSISILCLINKKYYLSSFFFGLALFTYNSSRVLLPFYSIVLIYSLLKHQVKMISPKLLPFLIFVLIFLLQTFSDSGQARYKWVSLLDQGAINRINELRAVYPQILINKVTYFTYLASKNYLSHFNPNFLFAHGGNHYQFSLQGFYLINPFFFILLFFGLFNLYKLKTFESKLIFIFLFLAPLPSAITRDAPHVLRSIQFIYFATVITSYSIVSISSFLKYTPIVIGLISLIQFWPKYIEYSTKYSSSWQYGYLQLSQYVQQNYDKFDSIIITKKYGEPHEFILFYLKYDPRKYQNIDNKIWDYHTDWYWIDQFDKFKFVNDWEIKNLSLPVGQKTLLVTSPQNHPQNSNLQQVLNINFLDGSNAFEVLAN